MLQMSVLPVQSVPPYISEMAPPKLRGGLNMLFQLMTVIGIFVASLVNLGALSPMNFPVCVIAT